MPIYLSLSGDALFFILTKVSCVELTSQSNDCCKRLVWVDCGHSGNCTTFTQFPDLSALVRHICRSRSKLLGYGAQVFDVRGSNLADLALRVFARSRENRLWEGCNRRVIGRCSRVQSSPAREKEKPRWTPCPAGLIEVQKMFLQL